MEFSLVKEAPIHLENIDRASVRRLVDEYTVAAKVAGAHGENIHQWSLDQQDKVVQFASTLSEEKAVLFWTLYGEEMNASTKAMLDKTNAINIQAAQDQIQTAQNASNVATWISLIVFFIVLISFINMMK